MRREDQTLSASCSPHSASPKRAGLSRAAPGPQGALHRPARCSVFPGVFSFSLSFSSFLFW